MSKPTSGDGPARGAIDSLATAGREALAVGIGLTVLGVQEARRRRAAVGRRVSDLPAVAVSNVRMLEERIDAAVDDWERRMPGPPQTMLALLWGASSELRRGVGDALSAVRGQPPSSVDAAEDSDGG